MENGMIKWTLFWALALGAALYLNGLSNDEAMAKCQIEHSYDTCFSALNR